MKTNNLRKRIKNIDYYISLASKLDNIVDEPEIQKFIPDLINALKCSRKEYVFKLEREYEDIKYQFRINQKIGGLAKEYFNGDFIKAKESLDNLDLKLKKNFFSYLRKAFESTCLCVITAPFSREISKIHHDIFESYKNAVRGIKNTINSERESNKLRRKRKKIQKENMAEKFKILQHNHFLEAKFADSLIQTGLEEKTANYIATEQPEIAVFICLESINRKYGKGII